MGKPNAPAPPDYEAAARAQGAENRATAEYNAGIGRPDEYTIGGTKKWTLREGADPKNPMPGDWQVRSELSPEQQQIYNQGVGLTGGALDVANSALGRTQDALGQPLDLSSAGTRQGVTNTGVPVTGVQPGTLPDTPGLATGIDTGGLAALPTSAEATRKAVTDAMIQRNMPQLDQAAQAARTRSIAAGGDVGSESYQRAEDQSARDRNDFLLAATGAGSDAAQKEIASQLALRGQGFGERATEAGFGNTALSQMFSQGLARGGQEFGQNLQAGGFANSAAGQDLAQQIQSAGFGNANRSQAIQEILMQRQLPLNEMNALRSGNQVQMPEFAGAQAGNAQPAPLANAAAQQAAAQQAQYASDMGGYNATVGGLSTAALMAYLYSNGGALAAFSDERLKENIEQVGTLDDGTGVYKWKWSPLAKAIGAGHQPGFGVIAQEHPEASVPDPRTGFLRVNYDLVGA